MRMYFQTESVARRFAERSEAVSGLLCWHQQYRNGWQVNVTNIPTAAYSAMHPGHLPVLQVRPCPA